MNIPDSQYLTGLMLFGVAWVFMRADAESGTSRALALALAMGGFAVFLNQYALSLWSSGPLPWWAGFLVLPEVVGFCAIFEWVQRVRRTIPAGTLKTRFGDRALRVAQILAVIYGINSFRFPELRLRDFYNGLDTAAIWSQQVVHLFWAPLSLAMLLWMLSIVLCLNRDPEPAERVRLSGFLVAIPTIASGLVLPPSLAPVTTVLGIVLLLGGAMRHAQMKGQQGQFMQRFLSPQVASMVHRDGLRAAMREQRCELSIISVDVRGFTAFAGAHDSAEVIALLREYYDAVGVAVTEFGGTIKDYAGDGVLILLGAPLPVSNHQGRALELAQRIMTLAGPVVQQHAGSGEGVGVGIGVASGVVTVGIIGSAGRLEYAAVGQAVNLASRLCENARSGEILLAAETFHPLQATALGDACRTQAPRVLKGFVDPVENYALDNAVAT